MTVLYANQFPGAERQPLAYPGLRPDFSYVYHQGRVHEITPRGDTYSDLWVDDSAGQVALDDFLATRGGATLAQRHAVVAVGSNGCPGRLAEKYKHQSEAAVPVLVGTLADTAVVYSRQLVRYGALPATYLYQPGAVSWLSVTMLTDRQLARMDETEGLGRAYLRIKVPGYFHVDRGPSVGDLAAYLDRKILTDKGTPVRLKLFAREGPGWPIMDEREVLSLVFNQAGLLLGEAIEGRHNRLLTDKLLWQQLVTFLEGQMSGLKVDEAGRLMNA